MYYGEEITYSDVLTAIGNRNRTARESGETKKFLLIDCDDNQIMDAIQWAKATGTTDMAKIVAHLEFICDDKPLGPTLGSHMGDESKATDRQYHGKCEAD